MSFHLRTSFQAAPVAPVAGVTHKTYYTSSDAPQPIQTATPAAVTPTTTPRHSLHQPIPTNTSMGLDSALEGLDKMDFSERRITSDISALECESVKADPHYNPAVEEAPFVPPLEIAIPVNLAHLAVLQQEQKQQRQRIDALNLSTRSSYPSTINHNSNGALTRPVDLERQTSCQSRLELSHASPYQKSKSMMVSHKMALKLAMNNGGVLPPSFSTNSQDEEQVVDADLEEYANGAGAVPDDQSRLSYYTSPTDLYTSDDSGPIVPSQSRKGMVKRELKRIMFRFSRTSKTSKKNEKTSLEPQHVVVEGAVKDYDSFGSERGFC